MRIHLEGNAARGQQGLQGFKVLAALVAEHIQHAGRILDQRLAALLLAVQHAQGIAFKAFTAGGAQLIQPAGEILLQRGVILGTAVRAADGIDIDRQALEPQIAQDAQQCCDQFGFHRRLLAAKAFHAELMMLTQTAGLGLFIAENRVVEVIHFAGQRVGKELALQKGAHCARRALGLQGDAAIALILEGVHFLLHDIGGIAHAAQEKLGMLKNGGAHLAEPCQGGAAAHDGLDRLPDISVLGQHIARALWCLRQHEIPPKK